MFEEKTRKKERVFRIVKKDGGKVGVGRNIHGSLLIGIVCPHKIQNTYDRVNTLTPNEVPRRAKRVCNVLFSSRSNDGSKGIDGVSVDIGGSYFSYCHEDILGGKVLYN